MTASGFRYRAFISYSHRDQKIARWLHGALEAYRVPQRLLGKETSTGTIAKRLGAIFRDRDELPVASDLSGKINEALAATQFLIVLCSTASAQSKWVNQEVINFKRIKGEDSIIAVIVDGEPHASTMPGREAEECFVPALRFRVSADGAITNQPAEPVAADLRPEKDSKRLVKLKVIAGLLGLGLDELVRRENQRRTQRMFWLTVGSMAAMVLMAVLTAVAIQSRNEAVIAREDAERQKAGAEDLIEFMLGDLRKKLQPVGRLDILDSVGDKALNYFATLKPNELDADTLGRQSRTLHLIGEIEDLRGNLEKARSSFAEAFKTTDVLLMRDPTTAQRIFDHAQSVYWLGYVDWQRGDKVAAERAFAEYQRLALDLTAREPNNIGWQSEASYAFNNVGVLLFQDHRFADALVEFEKGREISAAIRWKKQNDPDLAIDFAQFGAWIAACHRALGHLEQAKKERMAEADVYMSLIVIDPENRTAAQNYAASLSVLSQISLDQGEVPTARDYLDRAQRQARALMERDPENVVFAEMATRTAIEVAELTIFSGELAKGRKLAVDALAMSEMLLARDPDRSAWRIGLVLRAQLLLASAALAVDRGQDAVRATEAILAALDKIPESERRTPTAYALAARVHLVNGDAYKLMRAPEFDTPTSSSSMGGWV